VCIGSDIVITPDSILTDAVWITPQGSYFESELFLENADLSIQGDYVISAAGAICSTITDTLPLQVVEYPVVELNDSTVYCTSGYLMAHIEPGYDYYTWSNGDDDENAVVPMEGFLSVIVTNWPGCSDSDEFSTTTVACFDEFPNVFSPNGDGLNDDIDFGLLRLPIEYVSIYNRWGDLVKKLTGNQLRKVGGLRACDARRITEFTLLIRYVSGLGYRTSINPVAIETTSIAAFSGTYAVSLIPDTTRVIS
jgi:hypothetical protein